MKKISRRRVQALVAIAVVLTLALVMRLSGEALRTEVPTRDRTALPPEVSWADLDAPVVESDVTRVSVSNMPEVEKVDRGHGRCLVTVRDHLMNAVESGVDLTLSSPRGFTLHGS
jgi:hypothetical protein